MMGKGGRGRKGGRGSPLTERAHTVLGTPVSCCSFSNSAALGSRCYNFPLVQLRTVRPRGVKPMILSHTAAEWQQQGLRLVSLSNMYAFFVCLFCICLYTFQYLNHKYIYIQKLKNFKKWLIVYVALLLLCFVFQLFFYCKMHIT